VDLHAVTEVPYGFDEAGAEFSPQAGDENLDGVRIAIESLGINVFGKLALRDDSPAVMHEIGENAKFMTGEAHFGAFDGDFSRARIENERTASELWVDLSARPANERA
jgi:hypothetical protein